jgi:hypothetical protein
VIVIWRESVELMGPTGSSAVLIHLAKVELPSYCVEIVEIGVVFGLCTELLSLVMFQG